MVKIQFGIEGTKELKRRLSTLRRSMKNMSPWLKRAALISIESVQKNFDVGGRPKWERLSLATMIRRGAEPGGNGLPEPLRDTGILMNSISSPKASTGGIFIMDKFSVETGTNLKYAAPQHFGTMDGHIPARPFMFLQPDDSTKIFDLLTEYLDSALGPA